MTVKQKTLKRPHSSFTDAFGDERRRVITKFIDDPQLDGDNKIRRDAEDYYQETFGGQDA